MYFVLFYRFSRFIRQPQFDRHVIEREINVVNAENEKNMSNDQWRLFQLTKSTANPGHPYSKFGTGALFDYRTLTIHTPVIRIQTVFGLTCNIIISRICIT